MFRLLLVFSLLISASVPVRRALAQKATAAPRVATAPHSNVVVIVRGTTTLDPDVVAQLTGVDQKPAISQEEIQKRLETSGLFSYVHVERIGDTVFIRVRQKFTLFVLPYVSSNYTGTYYAIAAGKQIVLGEDALVAGHYQFGTGDHEGGILVRDGAVLGSPLITELAFSYEDALHWIYGGRNIVSQWENKFHGGHFQLGYRLYPYLEASLINYVEQHKFEATPALFFSGVQWSTAAVVDYNRLYKKEGLSNGYEVKAEYEETTPVSDFHFWRAELSPTVSVFRSDPLNWVIHGEASFSPSLPLYQQAELGGPKLRGYEPEEFRVNYYGTIQNDLFLTSSDLWKMNLRSLVFGDWGFVDGQPRPGAGAGLEIYPKRVAISAVQFYAGYGFNPPGWATAFSLGASFE